MSEQDSTATEESKPQVGAEQPDAKTFDADYVEKLRREAAKYRTEAKANADAAKRVAELEEASKTEAQKLAERAEKAERELASIQAASLRSEIALEKGLSASQARRLIGATREELEADADQLLADLGDAAKPRSPRPDPNQGRSPAGGPKTTTDSFAEFFRTTL